MMQMDIQTSRSHAPQLLFDWQLDIERLEREAEAAVQRRRLDQWALVEAECSLDLIDAELVAARSNKAAAREEVSATVGHLTEWRGRVERLVRKLRALPR